MITCLHKPTHALAFLGDPGTGGQSEIEVRGTIVARTASLIRLSVTRVKGLSSGRDYRHLVGHTVDLPSVLCHVASAPCHCQYLD